MLDGSPCKVCNPSLAACKQHYSMLSLPALTNTCQYAARESPVCAGRPSHPPGPGRNQANSQAWTKEQPRHRRGVEWSPAHRDLLGPPVYQMSSKCQLLVNEGVGAGKGDGEHVYAAN